MVIISPGTVRNGSRWIDSTDFAERVVSFDSNRTFLLLLLLWWWCMRCVYMCMVVIVPRSCSSTRGPSRRVRTPSSPALFQQPHNTSASPALPDSQMRMELDLQLTKTVLQQQHHQQQQQQQQQHHQQQHLQQQQFPPPLDSPDDLLHELSSLSDAALLKATVESLHTGRLTPLIKEELRCRIQSRRLSEGKDELRVQFDSPTISEVS